MQKNKNKSKIFIIRWTEDFPRDFPTSGGLSDFHDHFNQSMQKIYAKNKNQSMQKIYAKNKNKFQNLDTDNIQ